MLQHLWWLTLTPHCNFLFSAYCIMGFSWIQYEAARKKGQGREKKQTKLLWRFASWCFLSKWQRKDSPNVNMEIFREIYFFFFFFIKKGILCCRVITSAKQMYGIVPLQFLFWLPSMQLSKQGYRPLTAEDVILFINCKAPGYRNATQTCYDASHINNWSFYSSTQLLEEHATHRRSGIYWYLVQYVGNPIEARKAVPMIPFFTPYLVRP